jgi:hypothetical protein
MSGMTIDRESIAADAISDAQEGHMRGSLQAFIAVLRLAGVVQERHVGLADALISVLPDGDSGEEPTPKSLLAQISKVKRQK